MSHGANGPFWGVEDNRVGFIFFMAKKSHLISFSPNTTMSARAGPKRRRSDADQKKKRPKRLHKRSHHGSQGPCCQVCTLMLSYEGLRHLNSPKGFLHQTRTDCVTSADEGCRMCRLLVFAVCKEHNNDWVDEDRLLLRNFRDFHSISPAKRDLPGIYNLEGCFESKPTTTIVTVQLFADTNDPIADIVCQRPLRRDVQSDEVFAAAKGLINECMHPTNPHKHCQFSRDTVLPLRILDLGKPEDSCSRVKLKVNETDTHAPYLALSYCWGKPLGSRKPLQLRKSNLQRLVKGIKIRKLQQSIQDAICATRKLGYRYLWVDALCIIQDCDADKGTEIGRMASIYKNASITIAASTSENAAHGFLSGEMKPYCPDYAVSIPMANGTTGTVFVSSGLYELDHPLDKRGWTLQEFMLSSRMLIFSDYELLWQCKEVDLRSVSAAGLEYLQPLETLPWTVFENEDAEPFYGDLDSDKLYLWKTIVQQYTDRQLSYTSDKLNAIMGITSELQILWRDVNIYGHWKRWFIQLLVWYKPDLKREEQRHLERAPSWSWASMDGAIRYEGMLATEDARLKSLTVQAAELSCRMLKESEVADGKAATISKLPDLIDPMTELPQKEFNGGLVEYLLLGTTKSSIGSEEGVGLLVMKCGTGVYQRLGFVKFQDMTMWEGVQRRDITLDGRINKFSAVRKQKP